MRQMKKLFVVSDIHGHYTALKQALNEAGYDPENENHLFVCCGDLFDRGKENRKVYEYIRSLKRRILVRGNHDARLAKVLRRGYADAYDYRNGGVETLWEFFGISSIDAEGKLHWEGKEALVEELCDFVDNMLHYWETERYVFTHGWLPLEPDTNVSRLCTDWRHADEQLWHRARFGEWQVLYHSEAKLPDRTIVCGHRSTRYAQIFDPKRLPTDCSIFYGDGVIAIDGTTVISGKVNVLVVDEWIDG